LVIAAGAVDWHFPTHCSKLVEELQIFMVINLPETKTPRLSAGASLLMTFAF